MCGVPDATWGQAFKCTDVTSDSYTCASRRLIQTVVPLTVVPPHRWRLRQGCSFRQSFHRRGQLP